MSMIGNMLAVSQAELDALYQDPDTVPAYLYDTRSDESVDLDKAWHAIHFVLTGEEYGGEGPLAQAVLGGVPIGDEDVGYGPARGLSAADVKAVAAALEQVTESDLRAKFDADALTEAEIYPQIWDEGDVALDYVLDNFLEMRRFYQDAATRDMAVLLFIN
ncbi:MAG: YfbM family protein [Gammaproteobacteria bacterium]